MNITRGLRDEEENPFDAYLNIPVDSRWMCEVTSNFNIHELWAFESGLNKSRKLYIKKQTHKKEKRDRNTLSSPLARSPAARRERKKNDKIDETYLHTHKLTDWITRMEERARLTDWISCFLTMRN